MRNHIYVAFICLIILMTMFFLLVVERATAADIYAVCSGTGSLASQKDEGSRLAALKAKQRLCSRRAAQIVVPQVIEKNQGSYVVPDGRTVRRPVRRIFQ